MRRQSEVDRLEREVKLAGEWGEGVPASSSRFKSIWSYYGGKSRIAHLYPRPLHSLIIEPFAGGGSYSLLHIVRHNCTAILNDLDEKVYAMWEFMKHGDVEGWADRLPAQIEPGVKVSSIFPDLPAGLLYILQAEANQGTQGARGVHDQMTKMGAKCYPRLKSKLRYWAPIIRSRVTISRLPYDQLPNRPATWFIDPPYANSAGRRYRQHVLDYEALAHWCRERRGQVIACENEGATWLPFVPLAERRGVRSEYQQSRALEVLWHHEGGA